MLGELKLDRHASKFTGPGGLMYPTTTNVKGGAIAVSHC